MTEYRKHLLENKLLKSGTPQPKVEKVFKEENVEELPKKKTDAEKLKKKE